MCLIYYLSLPHYQLLTVDERLPLLPFFSTPAFPTNTQRFFGSSGQLIDLGLRLAFRMQGSIWRHTWPPASAIARGLCAHLTSPSQSAWTPVQVPFGSTRARVGQRVGHVVTGHVVTGHGPKRQNSSRCHRAWHSIGCAWRREKSPSSSPKGEDPGTAGCTRAST